MSKLKKILAAEGLIKTARKMDYEGDDFGIHVWSAGPRHGSVWLHWPLSAIGRKGEHVNKRKVDWRTSERPETNWERVILKAVKRTSNISDALRAVDKIIPKMKAEYEFDYFDDITGRQNARYIGIPDRV